MIERYIRKQKDKNLLREIRPLEHGKNAVLSEGGKEYVNLSSNDYLGLSGHPLLKAAAVKAMENIFGSASSRLMTGTDVFHEELESITAEFKDKEAALVFNSGYQANVGVISAILGRGDAVFSDRLNHASIIDGIMLSGAKMFRFRHNDAEHLELLLQKERNKYRNALIVTETVFSMDGDICPLADIVEVKKRYNCALMVDEAHATGIFGDKGSGIVELTGRADDVDIIMGTFSKALGSFGAYVATNGKIKNYLVNRCRSFIYSTSLPVPVAAANIKALELVKAEPFRRTELLKKAEYLRENLKEQGFETAGGSQIVPVITGNNEKALLLSRILQRGSFWTTAIRYPTVPEGAARVRLSVTYDHSMETLEGLLAAFREAGKEMRLQ